MEIRKEDEDFWSTILGRYKEPDLMFANMKFPDGTSELAIAGRPLCEKDQDYKAPYSIILAVTKPTPKFLRWVADGLALAAGEEWWCNVDVRAAGWKRNVVPVPLPCCDCRWRVSFNYPASFFCHWECHRGYSVKDLLNLNEVFDPNSELQKLLAQGKGDRLDCNDYDRRAEPWLDGIFLAGHAYQEASQPGYAGFVDYFRLIGEQETISRNRSSKGFSRGPETSFVKNEDDDEDDWD